MNRRDVIAGAAMMGLARAAEGEIATSTRGLQDAHRLQAHMQRYLDFGSKMTCGAGEKAAAAWMESELSALGYATSRQAVAAPDLSGVSARIQIGDVEAEAAPFARLNRSTPISAPLRVTSYDAFSTDGAAGAVVVVHLPRQRWSTTLHPAVQSSVLALRAVNAAAIVLVTHGPTSERIALNAQLNSETLGLRDGAFIDTPTFTLAPRDWRALQPNPEHAEIRLAAPGVMSKSFNTIAHFGDASAPAIVLSTPRTGWGPCGAERGPGIALFLELAAWLRRYAPQHRIIATGSAAHEFEDAGSHAFVQHAAPAPDATALWLHLGAGLAARDWHEAGELLPLPSTDPQRFLLVAPGAIADARAAFAGVAGLEQPYPTSGEVHGELRGIIGAGYRTVVGAFGAHRYHHTQNDDARCFDGALAEPVLASFRTLLAAMLGNG
jgi:hypothetical protein